jgi:diketogulonate reductase-like aldo/keto reductase
LTSQWSNNKFTLEKRNRQQHPRVLLWQTAGWHGKIRRQHNQLWLSGEWSAKMSILDDKQFLILPDGRQMPRLGQGTWRMGEDDLKRDEEVAALRYGMSLGMNLIDSAEMYGDGQAEEVAGEAIGKIKREDIFLISKVYPENANSKNIFDSCDKSLRRFGVESLDLYLLHWREDADLAEVAYCMESLVDQKKIKGWGVSNFDTLDMEDLWKVPDGNKCAINQVLYNLASRGIEFDLMPWQRERNIPFMAYCPIAQGASLREELLEDKHVREVASKFQVTPMQILLSFVLRHVDMAAIPKAVERAHVKQNAASINIKLSEDDVAWISKGFPAPTSKMEMEKI